MLQIQQESDLSAFFEVLDHSEALSSKRIEAKVLVPEGPDGGQVGALDGNGSGCSGAYGSSAARFTWCDRRAEIYEPFVFLKGAKALLHHFDTVFSSKIAVG